MPTIRISQQTWERLKTYATPLEDTADDVVNIALNALKPLGEKGSASLATRPLRPCQKGILSGRSAANEPL